MTYVISQKYISTVHKVKHQMLCFHKVKYQILCTAFNYVSQTEFTNPCLLITLPFHCLNLFLDLRFVVHDYAEDRRASGSAALEYLQTTRFKLYYATDMHSVLSK